MRKTLMLAAVAASALFAASAASAQNVSVQAGQVNNSVQVGATRVANVRVGQLLTGRATAIGNIYEIEGARVGQGITEVGSNNGGLGALQTNNAGQLSVLAVSDATIDRADLGSTSAGNAVNLSGVVTHTAGSRRLNQLNNADQLSLTDVRRVDVAGSLQAGASAIGNTVAADALGSANFGTSGQSGLLRDALQTNNGSQRGVLTVSASEFGSADLKSQAVGNAWSASAPSVTFGSGLEQVNNGFQYASTDVRRVSGSTAKVGATAIGNSLAPSGGASTVTGVRQINNGLQLSVANLERSSISGELTLTAASVGSVLSIDNTGQTTVTGGAQINNGPQVSFANASNLSFDRGSVGAQSVGNLIDLSSGAGDVSLSMPQTNNSFQLSALNLSDVSVPGAVTASTLSVGNMTQIVSTGAAVQGVTNLQINNGPQFSLTNVTNGSFGSLTAGASSIGNVSSVTIR